MITAPLPEDTEVTEPVYLVPYLPSHKKVVKEALNLAEVGEGDVFVDLGAGDGRVVIEAAKRGAVAVGVEIRDDLLQKARKKIEKAGLNGKAKVVKGDLFRFDWVRNATVVYMFLDREGAAKIKPLLEQNLRPGTKVITITYPIPEWKPTKVTKVKTFFETRTIYLYIHKPTTKQPQPEPEKTQEQSTRPLERLEELKKPKEEAKALQEREPSETPKQEQTLLQQEHDVRKVIEEVAQKYDIKLKPSMTLREELQQIIKAEDIPRDTKLKLKKLIQKYEVMLYKEK